MWKVTKGGKLGDHKDSLRTVSHCHGNKAGSCSDRYGRQTEVKVLCFGMHFCALHLHSKPKFLQFSLELLMPLCMHNFVGLNIHLTMYVVFSIFPVA